MIDTTPTRVRWLHLTPGCFVLALLAVEVLLWLSERFAWLGWHKGYAVLTGVAVVGVAMLLMLAWFGVALVFRLRFQFSIRSLLVLVVVVALPCSWLSTEMSMARKQKATVTEIRRLNGRVWYESNVSETYFEALSRHPRNPRWMEDLVGIDLLENVLDARVETDAGFEDLRGLKHLGCLDLANTKITGQGLEGLKYVPQLKVLFLNNTAVDDSGLEHIAVLHQLQRLYLTGTQVTDEGVAKLQQALPNCKITR